MNYEETIELEENVKIKNKADEIYQKFLKNIKLEPKLYKGDGRFIIWEDSHNVAYVRLKDDKFILMCFFLHETYYVDISPSGIFAALKDKNRGVEHLESFVSNKP